MVSLFKSAVILLPLCFVLHSEAAPLKWQPPNILKNSIETDRDDTYGPWEKNSWIGNEHPDDIHRDDLWPPLVPPRAAVRRDGVVSKMHPPTAETDVENLELARNCFHECPIETKGPLILLHGCHLCPPHSQRSIDSPETSSSTTVIPKIQKREIPSLTTSGDAVPLYTGAQQWQEYWNHRVALTSIPTGDILPEAKTSKPAMTTMAQSSSISTVEEITPSSVGTPLSTGAQQWQVYWDHKVPRQLLTPKAKFYLFSKIFALPEYVNAAMIVLTQSLNISNHEPKIITRESRLHGPITAMAMCDVVGQILTQDSFQGEISSGELASGISTTCRSLAQLYPQRKVEVQSVSTSQRLMIASIFNFFNNTARIESFAAGNISREALTELLMSGGSLNGSNPLQTNTMEHIGSRNTTTRPTESARELETHTTSSPTLTNGASATNNSALQPRAFYLFQPLEQAYTWLNDIYDIATGRHPRFPYNDPAQNINGCIYYPSPDRAAITGKVICPPDDDHK